MKSFKKKIINKIEINTCITYKSKYKLNLKFQGKKNMNPIYILGLNHKI